MGGGPGAIANCRPLRCPDCRTKATWVDASAAASCFTIIQNVSKLRARRKNSECVAVSQMHEQDRYQRRHWMQTQMKP